MPYEIINAQEAIEQFHQLMQPDSRFRVLRLVGEAKMGKTYLLTEVFPVLARQRYQACHAVLDFRNPVRTIPDFLHDACAQLAHEVDFSNYYGAHDEWINQPKVSVKGLRSFLSSTRISAKDNLSDSWKMARHLTTQFVSDMRGACYVRPLLLFDSIDSATETTLVWLMDTLLAHLAPLAHLRAVVAGRSVPEAPGSYAATCCSYELQPVRNEEEYIVYCRRIGVTLAEQSIRDFAHAFGYRPGLFVDYVRPTFVELGTSNG